MAAFDPPVAMRLDPLTLLLTLAALLAFASNSLLTRFALGAGKIDAATFTAVRLAAGAIMLSVLVWLQGRGWQLLRGRSRTGTALGAFALFLYAAPFSFAYLRIGAATGALVLFGVVQLTMIGYGLLKRERHGGGVWLGLVLAASGLALLAAPAASRPDIVGVVAMSVAGIAWGVYSLIGRGGNDPIATNGRSFLWSCPLALLLCVVLRASLSVSPRGLLLATISGAITSGLGYAIWYRALRRLGVTQAAVAQLSVPVIAALGAVLFLGEALTLRLMLCSTMVIGGVGVVLAAGGRGR